VRDFPEAVVLAHKTLVEAESKKMLLPEKVWRASRMLLRQRGRAGAGDVYASSHHQDLLLMLLELMETSQDGEESGEYGLSPVIEINFKRDFPKSCPDKSQPERAENCTYRVRKCYFTVS
jgi:hypothetical protein